MPAPADRPAGADATGATHSGLTAPGPTGQGSAGATAGRESLARWEPVARLAERSIVIAGIASAALFAMALITFIWGFAKVWSFIDLLLDDGADASLAIVKLLEVIDVYLLGAVLLILSIGLLELFVTSLDLPSWLEIHSLSDLKGKLIDVVQLVAAIKFLEKLVTASAPLDVLWYGLGVSVVILALLAVRWVQKLSH